VTFEATLRSALREAGFDVCASLGVERYDAHVAGDWASQRILPSCRSIVLVGHSGHHFWSVFERSPEAHAKADPVDTYTRRALEEIAHGLEPDARVCLVLDQRGGAYLPLRTLAEHAGMGAPSRLGILLHPVYGPWWALRATLYLAESLPDRSTALTSPCVDCAAPCESTCHGRAVRAEGLDLDACLATRWADSRCHQRCDARLACVVGRSHVYGPAQLAHHARIAWTDELRARARRRAPPPAESR